MISEFINYMRENLSPQDDKAIVDWLQVTAELSDANETLIRQELSLIIDTLKYVKNNFKPEVYQMSLRFPTLCNEIFNGALCFNAGYSKEEVAKFAEIGYLESGYIPKRDDEKGSFTVVQVTEPECSVTISDNVSSRKLERWIMRASIDRPTEEIADVLEEYTQRYSAQIKRILNEPLQKAFVKAIEGSTAVDRLIKFNPVTGEIENIPNENLEIESPETDIAPTHSM